MEKKQGNGHKETSLPEIQQLEAILGEGTIDKALKSQEVMNAIRMLILSDPDIMDNAMRYDIHDRRTCVAAASLYQKHKNHSYNDGVEELMLLLGLFTSIRGKRVNILSDTVIGERKFGQNQGEGLLDKTKKQIFGQ